MKRKENVGKQALYVRRVKDGLNNINNTDFTPEATKQDIIINNKLTIFQTDVSYDNKQYFVYQDRPKGPAICRITRKKFPKGKLRYYVSFWDYLLSRFRYYPLSRLIYLNYIADIPAGYVVDHIDNNSLNNSIDNLQCISRADNTKKSNK